MRARYPHKFHVNTHVPDFIKEYEHLKKGETLPDKEIRVGVRIMAKREAGR